MSENVIISAKLEDYLAAINKLASENHVARVSDIAQAMNVQMPTVTGALRHLAEHNLVNYEPYKFVTLTPEGKAIAEEMDRREAALSKFLETVLCVPADIAKRDACGMEHSLSPETLDRLNKYISFMESGGGDIAAFHKKLKSSKETK